MKKRPDESEPALRRPVPSSPGKQTGRPVRDRVRNILNSQRFAILCTQGSSQPYASIIGFSTSPGLGNIYFSTPKTTRKYRLLKKCPKVAVQADNRSRYPKQFMAVESLTATGRASEIKDGAEYRRAVKALLKRHPYLKGFYRSPTCALIRVRVTRYFHVTRFQEVGQWIPKRGG